MIQTYIELGITNKKGMNNRDGKRIRRVFKIYDENRIKKLFADVYPIQKVDKDGRVTCY